MNIDDLPMNNGYVELPGGRCVYVYRCMQIYRNIAIIHVQWGRFLYIFFGFISMYLYGQVLCVARKIQMAFKHVVHNLNVRPDS